MYNVICVDNIFFNPLAIRPLLLRDAAPIYWNTWYYSYIHCDFVTGTGALVTTN